jgi:hypothetical protein
MSQLVSCAFVGVTHEWLKTMQLYSSLSPMALMTVAVSSKRWLHFHNEGRGSFRSIDPLTHTCQLSS